jgi:hypothetical protein
MKTNNVTIQKKSLLELNTDFKEFEKIKNNFLQKYLKVISGVKVEHYRTKNNMITEIDIVFDAVLKEELYE